MKKLNITKDFLYNEYVIQKKSSTEIAKTIGCNYMTILNKLKEFGIAARKNGLIYDNITKEILEKEYLINKKGTGVIAKKLGCSQSVIIRRLKKFNIKRREKSVFLPDVPNEKFGQWTLIKRTKTGYICRCSCEKEYEITRSNLISGASTCCRYCARKKNLRENNKSWKGYKEISGTQWQKIKESARKRRIEFDLNIEYIWDLFIFQNKKCALTGIDIKFADSSAEFMKGNFTASLDRINSNEGYTKNNVQWTHKEINCMKTNFNQERFIELCKLVAKKN